VAVVQYTFTQKQYTEYRERNIHNNKKKKIGKCGPCSVFASYTLAFALQLRKKHGKTPVRVVEKCPGVVEKCPEVVEKCPEVVERCPREVEKYFCNRVIYILLWYCFFWCVAVCTGGI
jgi:hypothetical protein